MADEEAVNFLQTAKGYIEKGWTRGFEQRISLRSFVDPGYRKYCSIGALKEAHLNLYGTKVSYYSYHSVMERSKVFLHKAMREQADNPSKALTIECFNDSHKKEDVLRAFSRAIELAQEWEPPKPVEQHVSPFLRITMDYSDQVKEFLAGISKKKAYFVSEYEPEPEPEPVKLNIEKDVREFVNNLPDPVETH